jgi:hypothetical protein
MKSIDTAGRYTRARGGGGGGKAVCVAEVLRH